MGNKQSSATQFELQAKKDIIETNLVSLDTLLKLEYNKMPINMERVREYKQSKTNLTKKMEKVNKILNNGKH
jgi:hypothetical protein